MQARGVESPVITDSITKWTHDHLTSDVRVTDFSAAQRSQIKSNAVWSETSKQFSPDGVFNERPLTTKVGTKQRFLYGWKS